MNYLAHAYLSFNIPEILVGNMISDYVKGKKQFDYSPGIQQGITLHRAIDDFTDHHPATKAGALIFKPHYRLYGGAFMDVVYDHFLASDHHEFTETSLLHFSQQVYATLDQYTAIMPEPFARTFPYMKRYNWLYGYRQTEGIAHSFEGLVRRTTWLTESATAFSLFEQHYALLRQYYHDFFPAIKAFTRQRLPPVG